MPDPSCRTFVYLSVVSAVLCLGFLQGCGGRDAQSRYQEGVTAYEEKDYARAVIEFQNALQRDPALLDARYLLALCLLEQGSPQSAEQHLRRVVEQDPSHFQARVELIPFQVDRGEVKDAMQTVEDAGRRDPRNGRPLFLLARSQLARGWLAESLSAIQRALQTHPDNSEYLTTYAHACLQVARRSPTGPAPAGTVDWVARADQTLNKVLAEDPENLQALLLRAQLCTSRGDLEAADRVLSRAGQLAPQDKIILAMQANLLTRDGRFDEAVQRLRAALGAGKGAPPLEVELARGLMAQAVRAQAAGDMNTVQDLFKQARILLERNKAEEVALAYALAQTGNQEQAENIYDRQLNLPLEAAQRNKILFSYTLLALMLENAGKADSLFEQLAESSPESFEYWRLAALMGQPSEQRRQHAQRIFAEEGPTLQSILDLARSLGLLGKGVESARLFELAAALAPHSALPAFAEGTVRLANGDPSGALELFQHAYEQDPLFSPAILALADRMSTAGQNEQALSMYEEFLQQVPGALRAETQKALTLLLLRRDGEAYGLIDELLERNPEPAFFRRVARDVLRIGGQKDFRQLAGEILKLDPDSAFGYLVAYVQHEADARRLQAEGLATEARRSHGLAAQALGAGLAKNPSSLLLLLSQLEWELGNGAPDAAVQLAERILRLQEDTLAAFRGLIEAQMKRQDTLAAMSVCEDALNRWPENIEFLLWKVRILAAEGDFPEASRVFRQLQQRAPLNYRHLLVLARLAVEQGRGTEALSALEGAIALAPGEPDPYLMQAELLAKEGSLAQAEESLKRAEEHFPGSVRVLLAYGNLLAERGEHPGALEKYRQALKVRPGNLPALARLGQALLESGREEAVAPLVQEATNPGGRAQLALGLADQARHRGRLEIAEQLYTAALQHSASPLPAQLGLARVAVARKKKEQALQYYEAATLGASDAMRSLLLIRAGDIASASWGEPPAPWQAALRKAEQYYEEAAEIGSQPSLLTHFRLAAVASAQGQNAAAEDYLVKALEESPEHEILQLLLVQVQERNGQWAQARRSTDKILEMMSDAPDPLGYLSQLGGRLVALLGSERHPGDAYLGKQEDPVREFLLGLVALESAPEKPEQAEEDQPEVLQQALDCFMRGKRNGPDSPLGYRAVAAILPALGRGDQAAAVLEEWLEKHPEDLLSRIELARARARSGDFSKALAEVDRVLEQQPGHARASLVKAGLLSSAEVDRPGEAISILAQFVQNQPGHTGAVLSLMRILKEQGRVQEAIDAGESTLAADPQNPSVISQLAAIYLEQQDHAKALYWYEKALELTPNSPGALNNLAYAYAETGRKLDSALGFIQRALQMLPGSPALMDTLGYVYLKQGRPAKAIESFEEVLRQAPHLEATRYHLALAYEQQGNQARAIEQLQKVLAAESSMKEQAEELLERLEASLSGGG